MVFELVQHPLSRRIQVQPERVPFVELKTPDLARVASLLEACKGENMWANRGPLYRRLIDAYSDHMGLGPEMTLVPCANGGIALEAIARLHDMHAGRPMRWIGSAFSFKNLGRGYFSGMKFVDCTPTGLLQLEQVKALDPETWDGLVLTNPFGLAQDLDDYIDFARTSGKALLIDNAAGLANTVPNWPWQSFSLHHTKPYGVGEGGLALVPAQLAEELYSLMNYGDLPGVPAAWLNNGKLSDISCAFHLDRLERHADWEPLYIEQALRIDKLAQRAGLSPLLPENTDIPAMSHAYLAPQPFSDVRINQTVTMTCGRFYIPLVDLPNVTSLFSRLVNIPTHPDMMKLSDEVILADLERMVAERRT